MAHGLLSAQPVQHACFSPASSGPGRREEEDQGTSNAWSSKEEAKHAFKELLKDKVLEGVGKEEKSGGGL